MPQKHLNHVLYRKILLCSGAIAVVMTLTACTDMQSGLNGFADKANGAIKNAMGGIDRSAVTVAPAGPLYTPESGGKELEGLYSGQDQTAANYARIPYPRVALEYLRFGAKLPCWEVKATIWRDARRHHEETFQVCDVAVTVKDAVGQTAYVDPNAWLNIATKLNMTFPPAAIRNTGDARTVGPNPPAQPFGVQIAGPANFGANTLKSRLDQINARIAHIAGYLPLRDASTMSLVTTAFYDYRMWVYKFDENGMIK